MALDIEEVAKAMLAIARASLAKDWKKVSAYAEAEFRRLAQSLEDIATATANGKLDADEAASLLRIHRNTTITVLAAAKGMALVAAERAVNDAIAVVKTVVNKAAGATIL